LEAYYQHTGLRSLILIERDKKMKHHGPTTALFQLGFRPFFLASALFAIISMAIWMAETTFSIPLLPTHTFPTFWHAHEMIYGYGLAVIAGFLLTAVRNWTGIQTAQGKSLQWLLLLWVLARLANLMSGQWAQMTAVILDSLFILYLAIALTLPVVRAKKWKNLTVVSKIYFFLIGHLIYIFGILGLLPDGQRIGIYIGLYMVLSLILLLSRRVMPMFIENGVGYSVTLKNHAWLDIACLIFFLAFAITDIFFAAPMLMASFAATLVVLHSIRIWGWHTYGLWQKPLLWVLYIAYIWVIIGFALKAAVVFGLSPFLATHALAVGGIGMMSLGMMARVSLGHTGRNIMQPPSGIALAFSMLLLGAFIRVILPILWAGYDALWIAMSQTLWIAAFSLFAYLYAFILIRPRIDGKAG